MPTFDTPQPIAVTISLIAGDVRISAGDRADTVVEVRPANGSSKSVKMAEQTRVEYVDGQLLVKTPKHLGSLFGRLGKCRYRTAYGEIQLEQTSRLRLDTGAGNVTVDRVDGDAEATSGTGRLRVGHIDGTAVIKNSNGDSWIGEVTGAARVNAANGDIDIHRP